MSNDYINEHAHRSIQHEGETYINQSDAKITFAIYRTHINHQAAEITRLQAELTTARRDALAEIKQDTDELIEQGRQDGMEQAAQIAENYANRNHVSLNIAAAIRAALAGGKDE